MAKTITSIPKDPVVPKTQSTLLKNAFVGPNPNFDASKFRFQTGAERAAEHRPFTGLLLGGPGVGKTHAVIGLLRLGFKVCYITTDYAKLGLETVDSYFVDHPEDRYLLNNLRESAFGFDAVQEFSHHPESIMPDIYEWDPDWLFWDGLTSYQALEVQQEEISDDDFHKNSWSDWYKQKAGVIFPMERFLSLSNKNTGRVWNKLVTCGIKEKEKYRSEKAANGEWIQVPIEGTKKIGPDLNTSVQELIRFGFSLVIECTRRVMGKDEVYGYRRVAQYLETKSRGYTSIPAVWESSKTAPVTFYELWRDHIAAKHAPFTVPQGPVSVKVETAALSETLPNSSEDAVKPEENVNG